MGEHTNLKEAQDYKYEALPDDESIRILILEPGSGNEPLVGMLETVNIRPPGTYEPISYVWGPAEFEEKIHIRNGMTGCLVLTRNLYSALGRMRLSDQPRRVWADQVCINQKDVRERSQQVQLMNTIFKNATSVLVWLGLDKKKLARLAFHFVDELHRIFQDEKESGEFHVAHTKDLDKQSPDDWKALDALTSLPWFTRGWIVQEIGTEAPAKLFWGDMEIDWEVLYWVCEKLTDYHHLRCMFSIRTSEIKYVFQRFVEPDLESHHANRVNFIYELHRARGLKFSDDRDRIFAWLGHFSARMTNQELSAMEADYQSTEAQVYTDVAVRALKGDIDNGNGLALITLAAVQHMDLQCGSKVSLQDGIEMQVPVKDTLPTWVPDWRTYQSFILSEPISPFCAHGGSLPKLDIDEKRRLLRIWGLKVDMIENCSQVLSDKEFHMKADPANAQPAVETIWRDICRHDSFTLRVKYVNGQDSLFACMQTLSNGGMQAAGREKRPYHEIPISWWLEEQAMYLVKIFGQSDVVAPDVRKLAKRAGSERKDEQWSRLATGASKNRKFARTLSGYYVLGPQVMEAGDVICVLFGGKLPFCLRPCGSRYLLVGECYVHGLMNGEAMGTREQCEFAEECFEIA